MRVLPLLLATFIFNAALAADKKPIPKSKKTVQAKLKGKPAKTPEECEEEELAALGKGPKKVIKDLKSAVEAISFDPKFCAAVNNCEGDTGAIDCTSAASALREIQSSMTSNKVGSCNLTNEEMAAISYYSSSGYGCINHSLWSPSAEKAKVKFLVDTLNRGLKKLPAYKGLVRRGTRLPAKVKETHVKGAVVTYQAFTSTSTSRGFTGDDIFYIFSATGRPIMGFSQLRGEAEVLFPSNTKFKILDIVKKGGKDIHIMKEVTSESPLKQQEEEKKILALVAQTAKDGPAQLGYNQSDMFDCPLNPKEKVPKIFPQIKVPGLSELKETPATGSK